jgi:DNA replication and repair protein RecF
VSGEVSSVRVDRLQSTHFRNLAAEPITFGPGLNLLVGDNGQGKTNLLEAVYFFRFGRSFRAQSDAELIRFGESFCRAEVACTFADAHVETFAFAIERRGGAEAAHAARSVKIDGRLLARRSDLAGRFPAVLFGPGDLRVVAGEPEHRRRFFDMVGTMTDPPYLRAASEYRRTLEQRNAALKARATRDEMGAWNDRLVATGVELIAKRRELVDHLQVEMIAHARGLESPFDFSMRYDSPLVDEVEAGGALDVEAALREAFHARLAAVAYDELRRGVTLAGPHRDDVEFMLDGNDLRRFGSQGQRRLFAVLLKLAELSHLETELREPCVLLLDDVFSEFDATLMGKLQRLLDGARQVFVTSPVPVGAATTTRTNVYRVDGGRVSVQEG